MHQLVLSRAHDSKYIDGNAVIPASARLKQHQDTGEIVDKLLHRLVIAEQTPFAILPGTEKMRAIRLQGSIFYLGSPEWNALMFAQRLESPQKCFLFVRRIIIFLKISEPQDVIRRGWFTMEIFAIGILGSRPTMQPRETNQAPLPAPDINRLGLVSHFAKSGRHALERSAQHFTRTADIHAHAASSAFAVAFTVIELHAGIFDQPGFERLGFGHWIIGHLAYGRFLDHADVIHDAVEVQPAQESALGPGVADPAPR